MPYGYVIAQVTVTDPEAYTEYPPLAGASVAEFGGEAAHRDDHLLERVGGHGRALRTAAPERTHEHAVDADPLLSNVRLIYVIGPDVGD